MTYLLQSVPRPRSRPRTTSCETTHQQPTPEREEAEGVLRDFRRVQRTAGNPDQVHFCDNSTEVTKRSRSDVAGTFPCILRTVGAVGGIRSEEGHIDVSDLSIATVEGLQFQDLSLIQRLNFSS